MGCWRLNVTVNEPLTPSLSPRRGEGVRRTGLRHAGVASATQAGEGNYRGRHPIAFGWNAMCHPLKTASKPSGVSALCWMKAALPWVAAFSIHAATFEENFSSDPSARGWRIFADTSLFRWNEAKQNLQVTWDSSRANSYFYRPLGTILNRHDDFTLAFDLWLDDVAAGVDPARPSTFPFAIGFQNQADAIRTNFFRGTGADSPNLVEFDFFPDTGFGSTVWPAIWSTNSMLTYRSSSDFTILDLPVGVWMRITMTYTARDATLVTTIATNGVPSASVNPVVLSPSFTDFRVDTFAVKSYSSQARDTRFGSSLLAHGAVDNVVITTPPPPIQNLRGSLNQGQWQGTFSARTNWSYVLERTEDLRAWNAASAPVLATDSQLTLRDTNSTSGRWRFYRIKAQRTD